MYRIGIDPGISGALACLRLDAENVELIEVADLPLMTFGQHKQQLNPVAFADKLLRLKKMANGVCTLYLEQVNAMPQQGVVSMFNFGMNYGMIQGVIAALALPMVLVKPRIWKQKAGLLNKDKDAARTLVIQRFPEANLNHKKDIGKADAILIAMYG